MRFREKYSKYPCQSCGWNKTSCDVHHIKGRKCFDSESKENLVVLCPNCHRSAHESKIVIKWNLNDLDKVIDIKKQKAIQEVFGELQ